MSFPRYERYKESGVEWLGEVPEGWEVWRIRHLFEICKRISGEEGHDVLSITQNGIRVKDTESGDGQLSMDYSKYQFVEVGDFAMNHMDLLTGYVDVSPFYGVTSPDYRVFRLKNREAHSSRYYLYLFQNAYKRKIFFPFGQGSSQLGRWRLPTDEFNSFCLPVPSCLEQQAIVAFLDRETGKIDELVAEQERLIALLKEKRQAVISHTVTKGLNPDAPLKDSGIEWLGEVPEGWEVCPARRIIDHIEQGWSPECLSRPAEAYEWGVLKSGCVNRGIFCQDENKALPEYLEPLPGYEVREGDVLMSRASGSPELIGSVAFVGSTRTHLMLCDKIFRVHLCKRVNSRFFVALFNSRPLRMQIEQSISGADGLANNLPQSNIKRFNVLIPSLEEQSAIVAFLDSETARIDALVGEAQQAISLLKERRSALISAAVIGKIDVRHMEAA